MKVSATIAYANKWRIRDQEIHETFALEWQGENYEDLMRELSKVERAYFKIMDENQKEDEK